MAPVKGKGTGKGKGKQPAPKGLASVPLNPVAPVSSDNEGDDAVNAAILRRLEALVTRRGGPVVQLQVGGGEKRPRLASKQSFQAQVLASLAILEDDCGDQQSSLLEDSGQGPVVPESVQSPGTSTSQMLVYSAQQAVAGKVSS